MIKKIFLTVLVSCLLVLSFTFPAFANDYTLALTTHNPTACLLDFTSGAYPNIAGGTKIDKIVWATNNSTVAQTLQIYDTCTSSTAATLAYTIYFDTNTDNQITEINFPYYNPLILTSPGFNKSGTGSTVNVNVQYR